MPRADRTWLVPAAVASVVLRDPRALCWLDLAAARFFDRGRKKEKKRKKKRKTVAALSRLPRSGLVRCLPVLPGVVVVVGTPP